MMEVLNKYWGVIALLLVTMLMSRRKQWALGSLFVLVLLVLFYLMYFSAHFFRLQCLTVLSIFSFAYLMMQDGKNKGDASVFCKYNIFYKHNKISPKLTRALLIIVSIVAILRVVMMIRMGR